MKILNDLKIFAGDFPYNTTERNSLIKPELNPYLIYKSLKEIFGKPNNDCLDNDKTQWSYLFRINDYYVEIYDWKTLSTSIAISSENGNEKEADKLADKIEQLLEKYASRFQRELKAKIKNPDAIIIQNPFKLYYSTAENLRKLVNEITDKSRNNEDVQDLSDIYLKQFDLSRSAFLMYLSSFEAFLNLIYKLYIKEELLDERIYGTINRHQIDVKLRMIPTYCDGFKVDQIDKEDIRFKNYHRLVNLRNDFVHANFIKSEEIPMIKEDGFEFVFSKYQDATIPKDFGEISIEHVDTAKKYIDDVIQLVLESMKQIYKNEFNDILDLESIWLGTETD